MTTEVLVSRQSSNTSQQVSEKAQELSGGGGGDTSVQDLLLPGTVQDWIVVCCANRLGSV